MSNNGKELEILKITTKDGTLSIYFGSGISNALVSHALVLAQIQWQRNLISGAVAKETSKIQMPNSIIDRLQ